ncbi:putative MFS transporter [Xylona heveae TC161]|uniref:Putative MFS transporter n=1 Tax=Xylona heveae (strain CBS 132557 / TC161) TaxID=1328760 RepID=A0A165G647_XYLHT|nr:putative MFS transporter [Xylona heveae TC161]KZF21782.1 putative MFS transporter [Xylona heveae TC161]
MMESEKAFPGPQRPGEDAIEEHSLSTDPNAERKLVRKLDFYIIPVVMLLYLLSFLDRVNIGNARLYGLEEDLNLTGDRFQIVTSILFVPYLLSEVPSNLLLKKLRPSRWISFIATSWGIIATLTGVTQNYAGMIVCRLALGLVEGGLFPGLTVYLTLFYTKRELALRIGYLFVSSALAGAFGGLLAYGIGHMDGVAGQRAWRWIFILEGLPTVVLGVATWFLLPDEPATAYFLNDKEKEMMEVRRMRQGQSKSAEQFHWADFRACIKDWKVWTFCIGLFGVDTMLYGYSTFLPTIIKGLGRWTTAEVQALTIPCYALGAISYLAVARLSDHQQMRGLYTVIFGCISVIGYGILIADASSGVHYFGCFMVGLGLYVVVGLPLAWLPSNCPRYGKRTTATGFQLTFGNCAGVMAPFLYKTIEAPRYVRGHAVTLSMVGFATIVYAFMWFWLARVNRRRKAGAEDYKIENLTEEEVDRLGDESPHFTYTI